MKKFLFILMVGAVFSLLPGCNLDDNEYYPQRDAWVGFGLVQTKSTDNSFIINMDDGEVLYPVPYSGQWENVSDNERVLANFSIVGNKENPDHNEEYYVSINSLRKILFKGIIDITPAIEDSIGNDPIDVKDHWIKKNMLNFELRYKGGEMIHYINLVRQPDTLNNSTEPVVLELRHNANGDTEHFPLSAIVTFDLSSLKVAGKDSVAFKVTSKSLDDSTFEFTGTYKY